MPRYFFDEFDAMADKACEALKCHARHYVIKGAIAEPEEVTDLIEVKAVLCAALRQEVSQWRYYGIESRTEKDLMKF